MDKIKKHTLIVKSTKFNFSSSHMLSGFGKCDRIHGHDYQVTVKVRGIRDEACLIDFTEIKKIMVKIIHPLDHKILIPEKMPTIKILPVQTEDLSSLGLKELGITELESTHFLITFSDSDKRYFLPHEDLILLPIQHTTCEILCEYFYSKLKDALALSDYNFEVTICIEETPGSSGCYGDF